MNSTNNQSNFEQLLECPECGSAIRAIMLHDLNSCDNCGLPAHEFDEDARVILGALA
jgi:protein-arginine kinase activator protein McsA